MPEPIVFHFDFVSAYSHIAVHRIDAVAARVGRTVDWRCISLPHVFKALGHPFPATLPTKWKYAFADWARSCDIEGLPHAVPEVVPLDARLARSVFWHLSARDPQRARVFAMAVFDRYWGQGRDAATADDAGARQALIAATDAAVREDIAEWRRVVATAGLKFDQ